LCSRGIHKLHEQIKPRRNEGEYGSKQCNDR
jgi:hypothetical protein